MVHLSSPYSVPETLKRLDSVLQSRRPTELARIDHSGEAEKVGMKTHPTQLIIFGSPCRCRGYQLVSYCDLLLELEPVSAPIDPAFSW
jgi:hypothetical protein